MNDSWLSILRLPEGVTTRQYLSAHREVCRNDAQYRQLQRQHHIFTALYGLMCPVPCSALPFPCHLATVSPAVVLWVTIPAIFVGVLIIFGMVTVLYVRRCLQLRAFMNKRVREQLDLNDSGNRLAQ